MPGVIATIPKLKFTHGSGAPLAGGTLTVYAAGTTTLENSWQDRNLTILNTNPIALDGNGACVVWLDSTKTYKLVLKDALGATQWTQDNIVGGDIDTSVEIAGPAIQAAIDQAEDAADAAAASQSDAADSRDASAGSEAAAGASQVAAAASAAAAAVSESQAAAIVLGDFMQDGTGAVARTFSAKARERWSLHDHGAVGDGATDDRASIQKTLDALSTAGGGVVFGVAGKTYLVKKKAAATKSVGSVSRSYGLEIPSNVVIDLQGATIKAEAAVDYVLISNPTSGTGTNNNSNLGIVNGTIDYNQASAAGNAQAVAFYGVRKLKLDRLEIRNGYNIALDLEACDEFDIGALVFRATYGAAFYMGGAVAFGGAECTKGRVGSVTCYDTLDHPTQPGLPGNPTLINASLSEFGELVAYNSDAGHKFTDGNDLQIGRVLFEDGNKQNSGFKIQGASESQMIERVTVGEVISKNSGGPGLFAIWCRDLTIGAYIGTGNAALGLDQDLYLAGERIRIGAAESLDCGRIALEQGNNNGNYFNRSPSAEINSLKVVNPWSVATSATATALQITNGSLKVGKLHMVDDRATPKMIRYFGTSVQNKEQSLSVDEFYARGAASNPDFYGIGFRSCWVGRPDVAPLNFAGGTLTLSSAAVGTGVTATASVAVFAATDVGALIASQDGRGVSEITAYTSATVVTVANRVAWTGTSVADDAWYLDRGNGGTGSFTCTAAATSTAVTDYGFINTTNRGNPVIEVIPTNAAARTLGKPTSYTWAANAVTFNHPAAAGGETYTYRILGWTS